MRAMETERKRQLSGGRTEGNRVKEQRGKSRKCEIQLRRGREKVICSNSTFLPLIFLHNNTVKPMWSLETSCSPASLLYSPSIYPSFSVSLLLFTFHPLVTLVLCICFLLLLLWHFVHLTQLSCSCTFLNLIREKIAKKKSCLLFFNCDVSYSVLLFHSCLPLSAYFLYLPPYHSMLFLPVFPYMDY